MATIGCYGFWIIHTFFFLYLLADMDHIWWVVNKYCTFHKSYLPSSPCLRRYFLNGKDWRNAWLWYFFFFLLCTEPFSLLFYFFGLSLLWHQMETEIGLDKEICYHHFVFNWMLTHSQQFCWYFKGINSFCIRPFFAIQIINLYVNMDYK